MSKMTKRKRYKIANKENIRLKKEIDNIKNNSRESYIRYLEEENKKMLEWVQKIIQMNQTFQVENILPVQIPIYKSYRNYRDFNKKIVGVEDVVIPEIRYSISRYEEC